MKWQTHRHTTDGISNKKSKSLWQTWLKHLSSVTNSVIFHVIFFISLSKLNKTEVINKGHDTKVNKKYTVGIETQSCIKFNSENGTSD